MTGFHKIAISLPSRAAENVRRAVEQGRASSVSAYIAAAIEEKTTKDDLMRLLDEMLEETGGPLTAAEQKQADRSLGYATPRAARPARRKRSR